MISTEVREEKRVKLNVVTGEILHAAFKVHSTLGPGLLESAYEVCLAHELRKRGLGGFRRRSLSPSFMTEYKLILATELIFLLRMLLSSS